MLNIKMFDINSDNGIIDFLLKLKNYVKRSFK